MNRNYILRLIFLFLLIPVVLSAEIKSGVNWQGWDNEIFTRATKEKKLVLLDLEAIWCHWCHVMEKETYSDKRVKDLLKASYIPVKVDQDSRPDLSNRYKRYGWPATIIFNSDGKELAKLSGFIEPDRMVRTLTKLRDNPVPLKVKPEVQIVEAGSKFLAPELRKKLESRFYNTYDPKEGGLKLAKRFLDPDTVEYALNKAAKGESKGKEIAVKTLDGNLNLFDPVWGGVYQYSTHHGWKKAHFERLMSTQSNNMRIYAYAYALLKEQRYLEGVASITRYLNDFMKSPVGAFYVSQDADVVQGVHSGDYFELGDKERRAQGIPRIDKNLYSRENGWAISALLHGYFITQDAKLLNDAVKAADWVIKNRALKGGGFAHGESDTGGPYLGDNLYMGIALLELYRATGRRKWLLEAEKTARFIGENFTKEGDVGFFTTSLKVRNILSPIRRNDENIAATRFLNLLSHYIGKKEFKDLSEVGFRFISLPDSALRTLTEPGVLLAADELSKDPLHITIVGDKDDPLAIELYGAANRYPSLYKRLDWWDKREGPMLNPDVTYPQLKKSAAFICTESRCSLPIFKADGIGKTIERFSK